jgi:DNA mismatch repair protein MutS2
MKEEIFRFIIKNNLSIFGKNNVKLNSQNIFKTKDARDINQKVISSISNNFIFNDTKQLLKVFDFSRDILKIKMWQDFFKSLEKFPNENFSDLKKGHPIWKPSYESIVVTEDESTLVKLKSAGCKVVFINQQSDLFNLNKYEFIQFIDCGNFDTMLEKIPQAIEIDKIEDAYLERFLVILSSWIDNIKILEKIPKTSSLKNILNELYPIILLMSEGDFKPLQFKDLEIGRERINEKILKKIKEMTLSGDSVISILTKGIPKEIKDILEIELSKSDIPRELFQDIIPLKFDEKEVDFFLKKQSIRKSIDAATNLKKNSKLINRIPHLLANLEAELIYQDFIAGVTKFFETTNNFPEIGDSFFINKSKNLFISQPQPISFNLTAENRCSILTGANSGGKTTLLEHIIQLVSLSQMGFPISGEVSIPLFSEVYYFAKNKGSISRGAFENLLTQMSEILPGKHTLILADEIEAVTEPGVAGEIIISTAEFFIEQNCFLVIATHLGQEIRHLLPEKCRIDGIEAKGLTEDYELIVDHNPVLGKLANSTPELIIEKMSKSQDKPYFNWLFKNLSNRPK